MKIKDIINSQKNKSCLIVVHGPSLNKYLDKFDEYCNNRILIGCNQWYRYFNKIPDYWIIANPSLAIDIMKDKIKAHHNFSSHKPMLIYADSLDLTPKNQIPKLLENIPYIGYDQRHFNNQRCKQGVYYRNGHNCCEHIEQGRLTIQEELQAYTKYHEHYGSGDTVLVHMIAIGILLGCKEIEIIGADLNYSQGYARSLPNEDIAGLPRDIICTPEKTVLDNCQHLIKRDLNILINSAKNIGYLIKGI